MMRFIRPRLRKPLLGGIAYLGIAAAITWLCGPDSGALTGAVIPVDAGLTA